MKYYNHTHTKMHNMWWLCIHGPIVLFFASQPYTTSKKEQHNDGHLKDEATEITAIRQLATHHFLKDLKTLTSRTSKFHKANASSAVTEDSMLKVDWAEFLTNHPQYLDLYDITTTSCMDHGGSVRQAPLDRPPIDVSPDAAGPLKSLASKVGRIKRSRIERMILSHPMLMHNILSSDMAGIRSTVDQLSSDLELSPEQTKKIDKASKVFTSYRGNIRSITRFFQKEMQLENSNIVNIVLKAPRIVNYSCTKITSSIEFFRCNGFSDDEIKKMISSRPMILAYSTTNQLKEVLRTLERDLGIDKCRNIVVRYPQVLTVNPESILERARFLRANLKLGLIGSEAVDVGYILSGFPPVLWLSESNLMSKIIFLKTEFDFSDEEMRDILVTFPQILGLAVETNLKPKIDFLLRPSDSDGAGLKMDELKELVLYQPATLAYSLEGRIKPRVDSLKKSCITLSYAPLSLMSLSDARFDQWLLTQQLTWSIT